MAVKIVYLNNISDAMGPNIELGLSDGVTSTTLEIFPGNDGVLNNWSFPHFFTVLGGNVLFEAKDATSGRELWISDGTAAGTHLLKDINTVAPTATHDSFFPGGSFLSPQTDPRTPLVIGSTMFFSADDGTHGQELWKTDGTAGNTVQVKDINASGSNSSNPNTFVSFNGTLYFIANDGTNGAQIWKSDGTDAGTVRVTNLAHPAGSGISTLVVAGGKVVFVYNDGSGSQTAEQLYSTDGTFGTESLVSPSHPANGGVQGLTNINGTLYFTMSDGQLGFEMWTSNGTDVGTHMVADIFDNGVLGPGAGSSAPFGYFLYNGEVYFAANDDAHGAEIWKTNGTAAGTVMLGDINQTDVGGGKTQGAVVDPFEFVIFNNVLYFGATDGTGPGQHHTELWKTTGGAPTLAADLVPGPLAGSPTEFQVVDGLLYFGSAASASAPSGALFKYDGVNPLVQITGDYHFAQAHEPFAILLDNTPPVQNANTGTTVTEGANTTILNAQLDFNDAEQGDAQITYTVTSLPTNGTLLRGAVPLAVGGTFTQADIVGNLLAYTHNGSETANDSFGFSVSDGIAPAITGQTFAITVTPQNDPPTIASNGGGAAANINVPENDTAVTTVTVTDPDGPSLAFSIIGGSDAGKFHIDPATGILTFINAPNFEVPGDSDTNNSYVVQVRASDTLTNDDQTITVNVTNVTPELAKESDFNADGTSDILWRHNNGFISEWLMKNGEIDDNLGVGMPSLQWHFQDTGDLNGDAKADILWRHNNGQVVLWTMNGNQIVANQSIATIGNDWHNEGAADFGGDGRSDVLWRNDSGQIALWTMDGAQITNNQSVATVANSWHVQGLLDANADGKSDMLLRHDSGQVVLWTMDGAQITANQSIATVGLDWNIVGTGDFNGDGKDDILWRHDSSQIVLWTMDGSHIAANQSVGIVGAGYQLQNVADYSGDGHSDVLWRLNNGQPILWEMNGAQIVSNHEIEYTSHIAQPIPADWTILNHQYDLL